jgi:rhodanese-related sulfurtransferase
MSALLSLGRLIAPALFAVLALAPATDDSPHTQDTLPLVQQRLKKKEAVLIDVREQKEWDAGHLEHARLLPLSALTKKPRDEKFTIAALKKSLPTDQPIYLHCKAGGRCVAVADALRRELGPGYDLRPLKPGYDELVDAGFEPAKIDEQKSK